MPTISEPADFDVAIELIAELVAYYNREAKHRNERGEVDEASVAKQRGDFWFSIRTQLYHDASINDDKLNAIIAETSAQLRILNAHKSTHNGRELHAEPS